MRARLWQCSRRMHRRMRSARQGQSLHAFMLLIEQLDAADPHLPLHEQVDHVIQRERPARATTSRTKGDRGEARVDNLNELVSAARGFTRVRRRDSVAARECFLSHAVLGVRRRTRLTRGRIACR